MFRLYPLGAKAPSDTCEIYNNKYRAILSYRLFSNSRLVLYNIM